MMMDDSGTRSPKQGEVEKLSKLNFNLKLRIFYLEERLSKLRSGNETDESLQQEILEQKVLLEEKQQELDEKNLLLVKARNAIEAVNTDLALCKAELAEARNNPTSNRLMDEKNDEISRLMNQIETLRSREEKYKTDLGNLEREFDEMRMQQSQGSASTDRLRNALDMSQHELESMRSEYEQARRNISKLTADLQNVSDDLKEALDMNTVLKNDLDKTRNMLAENSSSLVEQQRRESQHSTKLQAMSNTFESKIGEMAANLKRAEQDKDEHLRACVLAEQKLDEKEAKIAEYISMVSTLQETNKTLENELSITRARIQQESNSVASKIDFAKEEAKLERSKQEMDFKAQIIDLNGKLSVMEQSRDDALAHLEEERTKRKDLEEQLKTMDSGLRDATMTKFQFENQMSSALRESNATSEKIRTEYEYKLKLETQRLETALMAERKQREIAEQELVGMSERSIQHELELRRETKLWEEKIIGRLNEVWPNVGNQNNLADSHGSIGSYSSSGETSERNNTIMYKIHDLKNLKLHFEQSARAIENEWRIKFAKQESTLNDMQLRLSVAEGRVSATKDSVRSMTQLRQSHGSSPYFDNQYTTMISQLKDDLREASERYKAVESKSAKIFEEKSALQDQLMASKEKLADVQSTVRHLQDTIQSLSSKNESMVFETQSLKTTRSELEENNRLLALEVEDRGKIIASMKHEKESLDEQIVRLENEVSRRNQSVEQLAHDLEKVTKQLKLRDRRLRESKAQLQMANNLSESMGFSKDDEFEQNILRQVEETEQVIKSSHNRQNSMNSGVFITELASQRSALVRQEETFSEVLIAAADLVEQTKRMLHSPNNSTIAGKLLRVNEKLVSDLHELGQDLYALHRRFITSSLSYDTRMGGRDNGVTTISRSSTPVRRQEPTYVSTPPRHDVSDYSLQSQTPPVMHSVQKLHRDMLQRLGEIGSELQKTADQFESQKSGLGRKF